MNPFFSILLPTKNRPNYLKETIQSVLIQDYISYELIVSDNFNTPDTKTIIDEFIDHPNLYYYRTEKELGMPDNWEFALSKARGKYIMVLPDRKLLYKDALKNLHYSIRKFKEPECCSWSVKVYNNEEKHMGWFPYEIRIGNDFLFNSNKLLDNFLTKKLLSPSSYDFYFPKSLNGCFKKSLADKAISMTGHFFNNEYATTPDYSSFFIQMALAEKVLFIGKPIFLSQGEVVSNGRYSSAVDCMPYLNTLAFSDYYHYVPVKAPFIYNLLINDFLCIKEKIGGNLEGIEIDKANYYASLIVDMESIKKIGLMNESNIAWYENELNAALSKETSTVKKSVYERRLEIENELKLTPGNLRMLKLHMRDYLRNNYSHFKIVNKFLKYRFNTALEAAGFSNIK